MNIAQQAIEEYARQEAQAKKEEEARKVAALEHAAEEAHRYIERWLGEEVAAGATVTGTSPGFADVSLEGVDMDFRFVSGGYTFYGGSALPVLFVTVPGPEGAINARRSQTIGSLADLGKVIATAPDGAGWYSYTPEYEDSYPPDPTTDDDHSPDVRASGAAFPNEVQVGLTKLEYFTAKALCGLAASQEFSDRPANLADRAIELVRATLEALDEGGQR